LNFILTPVVGESRRNQPAGTARALGGRAGQSHAKPVPRKAGIARAIQGPARFEFRSVLVEKKSFCTRKAQKVLMRRT
jgi:hypothetical protein